MKIDTIDSLQGYKRSIVNFSLTSSNRERNIELLKNERRLNVATGRARHLLVLIGDSSTITSIRMVEDFWRSYLNCHPGSVLHFANPRKGDEDLGLAR